MSSYLDENGLLTLWDKISSRLDINSILPKCADAHNSIYRGKDITYKLHDGSLFRDIANGTFDDIFVGDYFSVLCKGISCTIQNNKLSIVITPATNMKFLIAHLDKDLNKGDTALTAHHAVVIPEISFGTSPVNATSSTSGGYLGSGMRNIVLPMIANNIEEALGSSHLLMRRVYLSNSVSSEGISDGGTWVDSYVDLMPENEVYGSRMRSNTNNVAELYNTGTDYGQLAIFKLAPEKIIPTRQSYWVRGVASANGFCFVNSYGDAVYTNASSVTGVRPRFLIG